MSTAHSGRDSTVRISRPRRQVAGVRVVCFSRGQLLLVEHEDPDSGERYWVFPGGGRQRGESLAQAALREVLEETGIEVRLVRRLRVPAHLEDVTYALFLAVPLARTDPTPTVDLTQEVYLRAAAWHPITRQNPLGPLNPQFWGYLEPLLARLRDVGVSSL